MRYEKARPYRGRTVTGQSPYKGRTKAIQKPYETALFLAPKMADREAISMVSRYSSVHKKGTPGKMLFPIHTTHACGHMIDHYPGEEQERSAQSPEECINCQRARQRIRFRFSLGRDRVSIDCCYQIKNKLQARRYHFDRQGATWSKKISRVIGFQKELDWILKHEGWEAEGWVRRPNGVFPVDFRDAKSR